MADFQGLFTSHRRKRGASSDSGRASSRRNGFRLKDSEIFACQRNYFAQFEREWNTSLSIGSPSAQIVSGSAVTSSTTREAGNFRLAKRARSSPSFMLRVI